MHLTLDIANELYPLTQGEMFTLAVVRSLVPEEIQVDEDEDEDEGADGPGGGKGKRVKRELWRSDDQGLARDYEYVMHGKVSRQPVLSSEAIPASLSCGSSYILIARGADRADLQVRRLSKGGQPNVRVQSVSCGRENR